MSPAAPRTRLGIFILLRRLRLPLTVLIIVYAVAVGGFTLIPGTDPGGQPWTMGFLHAFYFVSFLGTTIGLGEIPYPFSDAQRLWATAAIYGTVVSWLYAIGALLGVLQDPLFRSIVHENRVLRMVKALRQPFYLVCGYDDAGNRVVRELATDRSRVVVIDTEPMRVDLSSSKNSRIGLAFRGLRRMRPTLRAISSRSVRGMMTSPIERLGKELDSAHECFFR